MGESQMRIDTKRLEVVETLGDSIEVADAVAVRILKAARIDFIDNGVLPPRAIVCLRQRSISLTDRDENRKCREYRKAEESSWALMLGHRRPCLVDFATL